MIPKPYTIIDISQPVTKNTACFPGDTPFDYSFKATYSSNGSYNVTAFTMSPHIGTHTDAASHVAKIPKPENSIGNMELELFIGPCIVIDLCPYNGEILVRNILEKLPKEIPPRILLRTRHQSRFDIFEDRYAYLSVETIDFLHNNGVRLIGMDTPSVDASSSKTLLCHHALIARNMVWIENLDLTHAKEGSYFLSALPVKFVDLEAAPVRAVLLTYPPSRKEG